MQRRQAFLTLLIAGLLSALVFNVARAAKEEGGNAHAAWTQNLQQAITASKKTGRPILANFTGSDWCPPCMAQEREIFAKPEFAQWADKNVILLTVDFPQKGQDAQTAKQNQALAQQFKINSYPTIVFFDAKGSEYGRFGGYGSGMGVENWIKRAQPIVQKAAAARTSDGDEKK